MIIEVLTSGDEEFIEYRGKADEIREGNHSNIVTY